MSESSPDLEHIPTDEFFGEPPAGDENPEEYMSNDQSGGLSEETGVRYDKVGEPEVTPHDAEVEQEEEEES